MSESTTNSSAKAAGAKATSRRAFLRNSSLLVAGGAIAASQVKIARAAHAVAMSGAESDRCGMRVDFAS